MKIGGLKQLPGKRIQAVVLKNRADKDCPVNIQLHIVFDDQTSIEFYSNGASEFAASGLFPMSLQDVRDYFGKSMHIVLDAHLDEQGQIIVVDG
jgi:hypothetical protein